MTIPPRLYDLLNHPDLQTQDQGVELCLSLDLDLAGEILATGWVEGWLRLGPGGAQRAWLRLLLASPPPEQPASVRLCLAGMAGLDALLPELADRLPGIEALDLSCTDVTDLSPLARLPRLRALWLGRCPGLLVESLSALPALEHLSVSHANASAGLPLAPTLQALTLASVTIPEALVLPQGLTSLSCSALGGRLLDIGGLRLQRLWMSGAWLHGVPDPVPTELSLDLSDYNEDTDWWQMATSLALAERALWQLNQKSVRFPRLRSLRFGSINARETPFLLDFIATFAEHPAMQELDLSRVQKLESPELWLAGAHPGPRMYRLRERIEVRPPEDCWRAGAEIHRRAGRCWRLSVPEQTWRDIGQDRVTYIKAARSRTQGTLRDCKELIDTLQDDTMVCLTLHQALRTQALCHALGLPAVLTPWIEEEPAPPPLTEPLTRPCLRQQQLVAASVVSG